MAIDLTSELLQGFDAEPEVEAPFLATSPSWLAWNLGRYLASHHVTRPVTAAASRGDNLRVDNLIWMPITQSRRLWRRK